MTTTSDTVHLLTVAAQAVRHFDLATVYVSLNHGQVGIHVDAETLERVASDRASTVTTGSTSDRVWSMTRFVFLGAPVELVAFSEIPAAVAV